MKLQVLLPPDERERYGVEETMLPLDLDSLLKLSFDELVAIEDEMDGGLSLARLRLELHEYSARHLRGIAWLALRQAGKAPKWREFKPALRECFYVVPPEGGDADPPARASGTSSRKAPARTSSKSARGSASSTGSRRTR
jgi:hypothetical protein